MVAAERKNDAYWLAKNCSFLVILSATISVGIKGNAGKLLVLLSVLSFSNLSASDRFTCSVKVHESTIRSLNLSECGRFMAFASDDGTAVLTSLIDGMEVVIRHNEAVSQAEFTPCGKFLLTRSRDKTAKLVKVPGGELVTQIRHECHIQSIGLSPCSRFAGTLASDGTAKVVSILDGKTMFIVEHEGRSGTIAFSPCSRFVVVDSWSRAKDLLSRQRGLVKAYSIPSGKPLFSYQYEDRVEKPIVSPRGKFLVIYGSRKSPGSVQVVSIPCGSEEDLYFPADDILYVAFSPCERFLAAVQVGRPMPVGTKVFIADLNHSKELKVISVPGQLVDVGISPSGSFVGVVSESEVRVASTASGAVQIALPWRQHFSDKSPRARIVFSPCERYVAVPAAQFGSHIFSLSSGAKVASVRYKGIYSHGVVFSPCGRFFAHPNEMHGVQFFGLMPGTLEQAFSDHSDLLKGRGLLGESFLSAEDRSLAYLRLRLESAKTNQALTRNRALELAESHVEPGFPGFSRLKDMIKLHVFPLMSENSTRKSELDPAD